MTVLKLLLVHERAAKHKSKGWGGVVLVEHWRDLPNITVVDLDSAETGRVEVLHNDLWPVVMSDIYCNEVFKTIEFWNDEAVICPWSKQILPNIAL